MVSKRTRVTLILRALCGISKEWIMGSIFNAAIKLLSNQSSHFFNLLFSHSKLRYFPCLSIDWFFLSVTKKDKQIPKNIFDFTNIHHLQFIAVFRFKNYCCRNNLNCIHKTFYFSMMLVLSKHYTFQSVSRI